MRCAHQTHRLAAGVKVSCRPSRFAVAFRCELYGRCLPVVVLDAAGLAKWQTRPESAFYTLCAGCPDKSVEQHLAAGDEL